MSRWIPVHRSNFVHDELTDASWIDLDKIDTICTLIKGGSRLVWNDLTSMDVIETPEQLVLLKGA